MKKAIFTFSLLALCLVITNDLFSQTFERQCDTKIDAELYQAMADSKSDSELYPIIVMMREQYDQASMNQKTILMDRKAKRDFVVKELKRFSSELQADIALVMNENVRSNSVQDFNQFWIFNGFSCKAAKGIIEMLASRNDVAMVFADFERQMIPEMEKTSQLVENVRGNAWNITKVNADDVWSFYGNSGFNGNGIVVAVIDTGVNYNHTDIANNMWNDGNGNHGYDYVNNDSVPMDDNGHGTHCAGTVAGYGTNGTQTGIAPGAKIMALKVLAATGSGSSSNIVSGIQFAVSNGADVLSLSLGGNIGGYWYYRQTFENVLRAGIPASVAAGNEGDELSTYPIPNNIGSPGNCPPPYLHPDQKDILPGGRTAVICVGATDQNDEHTYFTSVGPATWASGDYIGSYNDYPYTKGSQTEIGLIRPDIAAPGYQITSLDYSNNTGYCNMNGTSMATPCNAGVIALMLQANPQLSPREIDSILEHTAVRCEGSTKKNNYTGSGRIDAYAAVSLALGGCDAPAGLTASSNGNVVTLTWNAVETVQSYSVYRNNTLINSSVATNNFVDNLPTYGDYIYYVKSNCPNGGNSMASNVVNVSYVYPGPVVSDLSGDVSSNQVTLSWTEPTSETATLKYGDNPCGSVGWGSTANAFYWAERFPASLLSNYYGMAINSVEVYINEVGTYDLAIYQGTTTSNGSLFEVSQNITAIGWYVYSFSNPVLIDCTKDLWIVLNNTGVAYPAQYAEYTIGSGYGSLYSGNGTSWTNYITNYSWAVKTYLTDGTYTYNIYKDNTQLAQNQSGSSYSYTENVNGFHEYHLTTNYYGGASQASNSVNVPAGATKQFLGTGSTDWATSSNWSNGLPTTNDEVWVKDDVVINQDVTVKGLYINEDSKVTVNPNNTLTITEDAENLSGNDGLALESGAALKTDVSNLQGTAKRVMANSAKDAWLGGWHFLSSPVAAAPISDFTSLVSNENYDLYLYNEANHIWYNEKADNHSVSNGFYSNNNSSNFTPGRGYLASMSTATTMSFEGNFNTGMVTIPVTSSSSVLNGFNLIGNPYPCSIDWNAASGWTRDVLGSNPYFYIYDDAIDQYRTYSVTTGGTPNGTTSIIAPDQAFFVKATTNGNIVINDAVKTTTVGTFRKGDDNKAIRIRVSGKNGSDEVLISELEHSQSNAEKMFSLNEQVPSLSIRYEDSDFSIYIVDVQKARQPMTMAFRAGKSGTFTLSSANDVEILDLRTGITTDLSNGDYAFEANSSDYAERFVVRLKGEEFVGEENFVYQYGDEWVFRNCGRVQVVDLMGRVVIDTYLSGTRLNVSSLKSGVYVVRSFGEEVMTQKMLKR